LFDTHLHLEPGIDDVAALLATARAAGVGRFLFAGTGLADSRAYVELAGREPGVVAAVGVHPGDLGEFDGSLEPFRELAQQAGCVAIGEVGLDYYRDRFPRDRQREVFRRFLELAVELKLPALIHGREAMADAEALLREAAAAGGRFVLHSFAGTPAEVERFVALGACFGVSGMVTFAKAENIRAAVAAMPAERILLETDSPWLAPVPHRGRRNQPAYVAAVARAVADIKGWSFAEAAARTTANAERFFGLA
jgi:TatD DNase family protein